MKTSTITIFALAALTIVAQAGVSVSGGTCSDDDKNSLMQTRVKLVHTHKQLEQEHASDSSDMQSYLHVVVEEKIMADNVKVWPSQHKVTDSHTVLANNVKGLPSQHLVTDSHTVLADNVKGLPSQRPMAFPTYFEQIKRTVVNRATSSFGFTHIVVVGGLSAIMLLFAFSISNPGKDHADEADVLRNQLYIVCAVVHLSNSILILDSLDLSRAMGKDAAFSGRLIGVWEAASIFGSIPFTVVESLSPGYWRRAGYATILFAIFSNIVYACVYVFVAKNAGVGKDGIFFRQIENVVPDYSAWHKDYDPDGSSNLALIFMCARIFGGLGLGLANCCCVTIITRVTSDLDLPGEIVKFTVANAMGAGIGPGLVALVGLLDRSWTSAAWLNLILVMVTLLTSCLRLPSLATIEDMSVASAQSGRVDEVLNHSAMDFRKHRLVLAGSFAIVAFSGYIRGALEVASAAILEVDFSWSMFKIGLCVGLAPLMAGPFCVVFRMHEHRLSQTAWLRLLWAISFLGAFSLPACTKLGAPTIILGDIVSISSVTVLIGLAYAVAQQHVLPDGHLFADTNTCIVWREIAGNGIGYGAGTWLSRLFVQIGGIRGFFWSQFFVTFFLLLLYEILVNPFLSKESFSRQPLPLLSRSDSGSSPDAQT